MRRQVIWHLILIQAVYIYGTLVVIDGLRVRNRKVKQYSGRSLLNGFHLMQLENNA